ncbi:leucine-rich repeat extensin-like protein 5 [Rhincodon typus]|uniref:leucine-rich repeat extensin-like protein 5 n=1 Tax=Rhincodon typus TaxID=259920 RepID=UPI00203004E3|nr:leucine-rich repeat extensin-like protein 5 [Rhincodon typus]
MAEFRKTTGVRTTADAFQGIPQPPPYELHPPPYSAISSPNPSVLQRNETYASPGYQPNYPAFPPYPSYPTYPAAPQPSNAHPQNASYQKSVAASSVAFAAQNTGAARPPPISPYSVIQQRPNSVYVFNTQNPASTYVVNQQQIAPAFVVNQQHSAPPVVLIQSGNVATGNHITNGYPTAMTLHQSAKNLSKGLTNIVLSNVERAIDSQPRNKGKKVTVMTGGSHVVIYK